MKDLISRQAAIDALNQKKIYRPLDSDRYVISDCLNTIVNLPSVQPQRMRGRWIPTEPDEPCFYLCSICRRLNDEKDNFCKNCGAKMEGTE